MGHLIKSKKSKFIFKRAMVFLNNAHYFKELRTKMSDDWYRTIVDNMQDSVFFSDNKLNIAYANPAFCRLSGYSLAYIIGRSEYDFWDKKTGNYVRKITRIHRKKNISSSYEGVIIAASGEKIPVLCHGISLPDFGTVAIVTDLRERKKTEIKLAERVKEFNCLYRIYSHLIIARPLSRVLSDIASDIIHAFQFTDAAYAQIVFDDSLYQSSRKKHNFKHVLEHNIVINDVKRGQIRVGYFKEVPYVHPDIFWREERKLAETVAHVLSKHILSREIIERHKKIVRKSYTGIFISTKGHLRYGNPRFFKMFKYSKSELTGHSMKKVLPDYPGAEKLHQSNASSYRYYTRAKQKDGGFFEAEVLMQKIDYAGQKAALGRIYDLTILKKAEARLADFNTELKQLVAEKTLHLKNANKRLKSLNELKDEFIAVASHELRSPLTSVRGYLSFLVEKDALESIPESMRQYLLRAYNHTEALNYLVNNILDVSRLDTGRFELQPVNTDIVKLAKSVVDGLSFQAGEKRLRLNFQSGGLKQLIVKIDVIRISQVLRNLLDNAVKFSRTGKAITLKVAKTKRFAVIKVIDQGVGIPKAKLEEIFDKFMQIKNADTRYKGGAGLGLFIARRIIELHGGTINVESQKEKGATFTIKLPIN